jgi:hypothetical protein
MMEGAIASVSSNSKSIESSGFPNLQDSQIIRKLIHGGDGVFAVPSFRAASRLCRLRIPGRGAAAISRWLISAFRPLPCFFLQSASFLSFQRRLEKGQGRSNCQTLFGIGKIPSDNDIRDMLDAADPGLLQPCFARIEQLLAQPALRQAFGRLSGRTVVAWDGTEYFCSQKIDCPHCLTRKRSNGEVENYHTLLAATVVAPGHSRVVPLFPEFIARQDGAEKQNCERNAVKRWYAKHGERLRPLRPVYLGETSSPASPLPKW